MRLPHTCPTAINSGGLSAGVVVCGLSAGGGGGGNQLVTLQPTNYQQPFGPPLLHPSTFPIALALPLAWHGFLFGVCPLPSCSMPLGLFALLSWALSDHTNKRYTMTDAFPPCLCQPLCFRLVPHSPCI